MIMINKKKMATTLKPVKVMMPLMMALVVMVVVMWK